MAWPSALSEQQLPIAARDLAARMGVAGCAAVDERPARVGGEESNADSDATVEAILSTEPVVLLEGDTRKAIKLATCPTEPQECA